MEDSFVMEVFEARYDLPEVVTYFRICQGVSCFPNMCQGLQQRKHMVNLIFSPDAVTVTSGNKGLRQTIYIFW